MNDIAIVISATLIFLPRSEASAIPCVWSKRATPELWQWQRGIFFRSEPVIIQ